MFTHRKVPCGPRSRLRARKRSSSHRWLSQNVLRLEALEDRRLLSAIPLGAEFEVATLSDDRVEGRPEVAHDAAGNFVVVWNDLDIPDQNVLAQRFDASGAPQGDVIVLSSSGEDASVAMNDSGQFVAA